MWVHMQSVWCLVFFATIAADHIEEEETSLLQIAAAHRSRTKKPQETLKEPAEHHWPSGRGAVGRYSWSHAEGPLDISKPTWSWHDPHDLWATVSVGTSIDNQKNIYLTTADGVRKFSHDGQLLWTYQCRRPKVHEVIYKAATLMGDAVYGITTAGRAFALKRDTGDELWSTQVSKKGSDANYGHVMANEGVVITATDVSSFMNRTTPSCCGPSDHKVVGLDATDGKLLWEYTPDIPVWNFGCSFANDGTFIFQDLEGNAYRNWVKNGSLVWKAKTGVPESWTDGIANLGANGIVYTVANYGMSLPGTAGLIAATNLSDGKLLWKHSVPKSPNSVPAVGLLNLPGKKDKYSVVIPAGWNDFAGAQNDVYAFDAETGEPQWIFNGPMQTVSMGAGDEPAHMGARIKNHVPPMTMPNSWATATIDGRGTVYVGGTTGDFYALQDKNGDGQVAGPDEVKHQSTPAAFVGSSGAALAPGLMAIGNANSLFVWNYPVSDGHHNTTVLDGK